MMTGLIVDGAMRTPGKPALIYNGRAYSYADFAALIARARGFFVRRGVAGPGIAILAVRNLMDFWVLSLAARSLGLTTAMVDTVGAVDALGLPEVRCVVSSRAVPWPGLVELCAARGWTMLPVSLDGEAPLRFDRTAKQGGHILLTSGTTGHHKMVLMTPESDAYFLEQRAGLFGMDSETVLCVFDFPPWTGTGYKWAASPWLSGGACMLEQSKDVHAALLRPGITHARLGPAKLDRILAQPQDAFPRNTAMMLAVGGGPMTDAQCLAAKARITPKLFGLLSCTEAGAIAMTSLESPEDRRWHRPVPGRRVEIVDESDNPVPMGETGRLRVGIGGGPAGYYRNDEATRLFFRDGFFYTGDLAVLREDGRMALMGRITDVLNVSGNKISPYELETRLAEALGVRGVCLFSAPGESGEEEVHAVIETPHDIEPERLRAAFGDSLRGFARAHVRFLDTLPRGATGKILRQKVRAEFAATPVQTLVIVPAPKQ
jgi:acyl-coenzyme A synthetase/AMP-(fatty) acid ligase